MERHIFFTFPTAQGRRETRSTLQKAYPEKQVEPMRTLNDIVWFVDKTERGSLKRARVGSVVLPLVGHFGDRRRGSEAGAKPRDFPVPTAA